jgi:hypothetical protein
MIGELVAQGRLDIVVPVSFAVASTLLALLLIYRVRLSRLMEGLDHLAHAG